MLGGAAGGPMPAQNAGDLSAMFPGQSPSPGFSMPQDQNSSMPPPMQVGGTVEEEKK